jgi:hypothetical protein
LRLQNVSGSLFLDKNTKRGRNLCEREKLKKGIL